MKIRLRADLRCPKGHRVPKVNGGFRASCEWCERLYGNNGIAAKAALLEQEISSFEKWVCAQGASASGGELSSGGVPVPKAPEQSGRQSQPYTPTRQETPPAAPPETVQSKER